MDWFLYDRDLRHEKVINEIVKSSGLAFVAVATKINFSDLNLSRIRWIDTGNTLKELTK